MDYVDRLKIAWLREFGVDMPLEFVVRIDCQNLTSENASGELLNKLSSASDKTKSAIEDLRIKLKHEEFFFERIKEEIKSQKNRDIFGRQEMNESALYAQVNKPSKSKQLESSEQNDKNLNESDQTLSVTCQPGAYEDIDLSSSAEPSNMENKSLKVKTESLSGQKKVNVRGSVKDKIKIFEISESSSSDESGGADGDYEQLAQFSPPPPISKDSVSEVFRKRQQHNSYEEITLPFVGKTGSDHGQVENKPNKSSLEAGQQQSVCISNITSVKTQVEHPCKQEDNQAEKKRLSQSGKIPPPLPARKYRDYKEDFSDAVRKWEEPPAPTFSDKEPKLSGSLKKTTDSKPHSDAINGKDNESGTRLSGSDPGGDYCSLSEVTSFKKDAGKHITLVKVTSNGSEKSDGEKKQVLGGRRSFKVLSVKRSKELSKSTDDLSSIKVDSTLSSAPKEAKSIEDLCSNAFYDDVYIPDESDTTNADMKKVFGHKSNETLKSREDPNLVSGSRSKSLSSSSSEGDEDLMKTVPIEISIRDEQNKHLKDKENTEESRFNTKSKKNKNIPDYEQWNFQTLLTKTGISVAERENLTDTASEDDNIYDNIADKQETQSGHSDDSGVSETTTPDENRAADQLRVDSITGSPDLRSSKLSSSTGSRVSTTCKFQLPFFSAPSGWLSGEHVRLVTWWL